MNFSASKWDFPAIRPILLTGRVFLTFLWSHTVIIRAVMVQTQVPQTFFFSDALFLYFLLRATHHKNVKKLCDDTGQMTFSYWLFRRRRFVHVIPVSSLSFVSTQEGCQDICFNYVAWKKMRITKRIVKALYHDLAYGYLLETTSEQRLARWPMPSLPSSCVSARVRSGSRIESQNMKSGGEGERKRKGCLSPSPSPFFLIFAFVPTFAANPLKNSWPDSCYKRANDQN